LLFTYKKLQPYTLAGFDLTTNGSNLLGGRRRRYHYLDYAARAKRYFLDTVFFIENIAKCEIHKIDPWKKKVPQVLVGNYIIIFALAKSS
jgi:hypothetical protein